MREVVIVDAVRTPTGRGRRGGLLAGIHPVDLLGEVLERVVDRNSLDPAAIDDVVIGCVAQTGEQGGNVARWSALAAGLPDTVPGLTVDRQCGSSLRALAIARHAVAVGAADVVIVGGVESMSRVPIGSTSLDARASTRLAARFPDGLVGQGVSADLVALDARLSREELDAFAVESHRRAAAAWVRGAFRDELVVPAVLAAEAAEATGGDAAQDALRDETDLDETDRDETDRDETIRDETIRDGTSAAALAGLPPAFRTDELARRFPELVWTTTAGNSSPLSDGASAVLVMSAGAASDRGLRPRARILADVVVGSDPLRMLDGVIPATRAAVRASGVPLSAFDAIEVNEAFASVVLAWHRAFPEVDPARVNPLGGAVALGHALGSSGTRLLTTLLTALDESRGRYGLVTMCEGGGMADAVVVERLP